MGNASDMVEMKSLLVVGLNGTPRIKGNSEILMDEALAGAAKEGAEVKRIDVARMKVAGCTACGVCLSSPGCTIDDDMDDIYALIGKADVLIVSSPLYFSGLSSQLKAAIDRCQTIWANGPERVNRPGGFICVGGDANANFRNAISEARSFLKGVGFECKVELVVSGVDVKGSIIERADVIKKAHELGRSLASMI